MTSIVRYERPLPTGTFAFDGLTPGRVFFIKGGCRHRLHVAGPRDIEGGTVTGAINLNGPSHCLCAFVFIQIYFRIRRPRSVG